MNFYKKDNILRHIEYKDGTHYFTSVKDADGEWHEILITEEVYLVLLKGNRKIRNCQSSDERNTEQSELTEESCYDRTFMKQKSVEQIVMDKLRDEQVWLAIESLPETQKRRVKYHLYYEYTLEEIAEFEYQSKITQKRCSPQAIKASVDIAKQKIKKILKNRL